MTRLERAPPQHHSPPAPVAVHEVVRRMLRTAERAFFKRMHCPTTPLRGKSARRKSRPQNDAWRKCASTRPPAPARARPRPPARARTRPRPHAPARARGHPHALRCSSHADDPWCMPQPASLQSHKGLPAHSRTPRLTARAHSHALIASLTRNPQPRTRQSLAPAASLQQPHSSLTSRQLTHTHSHTVPAAPCRSQAITQTVGKSSAT
jgi:hypothetical protein